ncbi:MAG: AMP-dependent synthetase/ligase [Candidatus Hodarchaeota archaeon]
MKIFPELKAYNSIPELLLETVKYHGDRPYLRWRNEVGQVHEHKFKEVKKLAGQILGGLASLGIKSGDHVSIGSETRQEWVITDLGILSLGGVVTTIYPSLTAAQFQYILDDSETKIAFVDDKENLSKIIEVWPSLPKLEHVFYFDKIIEKDLFDLKAPKDKTFHIDWLLSKGEEYINNNPVAMEDSIAKIKDEDLASIIYTSGTTGVPKGVCLTHRNFLSNALCSEIIRAIDRTRVPWEQNSLTFMPLSHVYARSSEEFLALYNGACICFAGGRSPAIIETGFKAFKPTLMAGIPYVYEKIYQQVLNKIKKYPEKMQKLFFKGLEFGKRYNNLLAEGKKPPLGMRIRYWIDNKLIYSRVHKELGGRLLGFVSGSARLSPELVEFFWALNVRIMDGYGLTETSPVTNVNRPIECSDFRSNWPAGKKIHPLAKLGSVGPPINFPESPYPDIEQKIADDGELLIRGPCVMKGYWKKPEETKAVLEDDGWLHTGDLGRIDEDGYLFITGRKKVIVKLSTGKMVAPAYVEEKITLSDLILQVILVGSERKYLTAFVVPDQKGIKNLANERNIPYKNYQDLLQNQAILEAIKEEILEKSKNLAAYETIKKFAIFAQEFNEDDGYMTPTLKFKRNRILDDFKDIIDMLYASDKDYIIVDRRLVDFHELSLPGY